MRSVSISKAMLVVAFVAAHLAVPRLLISAFDRGGDLLVLLVGLVAVGVPTDVESGIVAVGSVGSVADGSDASRIVRNDGAHPMADGVGP